MNIFKFPNRAIVDHFTQPRKVMVGMALHAYLSSQLMFLLQIGLTDDPCLVDSNTERLFHVDVQITIESPV